MTTPNFISLPQTSPLYSEWYLTFYTTSLFGYLLIIPNLIWLEPNCWSFPILFFLWSSTHLLMAKPFLIPHAKQVRAIFDSSLFLTSNLLANICIISHQIISKISLLVSLLFSLFLNTVVRIVLLKCISGHVAFLFRPTYSKRQSLHGGYTQPATSLPPYHFTLSVFSFIVSAVATLAFLLFCEHFSSLRISVYSMPSTILLDFCMTHALTLSGLYLFIFTCNISWPLSFNCKLLPQHSISPFLSPLGISLISRPYLPYLVCCLLTERIAFCFVPYYMLSTSISAWHMAGASKILAE